jgi:glycerate 2-kinase
MLNRKPTLKHATRNTQTFTVLVAPSGFKESLGAREVADHIATGVLRVMPHAKVLKAPMVDGGEGFTEALVDATGGTVHALRVTGPVGEPVESFFGLLGSRGPNTKKTAVIEMAAAAGLRLVPRDRRNPMLLLGCGDSGINDGGAGMVQALGAQLLDDEGWPIGHGGGELSRLARIDLSGLDPRLAHVQLDAAVNWHNMLLGERGVARVFGPQKGATPEQVAVLEGALLRYARKIAGATGVDVGTLKGGGASGGLGAGFAGLLGGRLHPRFEIVMQYLELDHLIDQADLVITAEGSLDGQTPFGKIPAEVAQRAKRRGLPVIALAGTIGKGVRINFDHGIDAFASILKRPCSLDEAIANASKLLVRAAEDVMRMVSVGMALRVQHGVQKWAA